MDDGEVRINTKVDTTGLDKGLNDVNKKLNKAQQTLNKGNKSTAAAKTVFNELGGAASGAAQKLQAVASAGGPYAAAAVAVVAAGKKMIDSARECAEAFKVQERAEISLETAAKNNPFLNMESVDALKAYASQLQSVSNYGDEQLIPLMTQLAASGRKQSEIMEIMAASTDMAASGAFSLESAVRNLNKTYGGLSGELGETIPEIKGLTAEQLKNGEAVKLMAEKYKGMGASMADARIQAQNAKGDFKEAVGQITNVAFQKSDTFWAGFWTKGTEVINKLNDKLEELNFKFNEKNYLGEINTFYTNKNTGVETTGARYMETAWLKQMQGYLEAKQAQKELNSAEKQALILIKEELGYRERSAKYEKEQRAEAEKRAAAEKEIADAQKTAQGAKDAYTAAIDAKKKELELRKKTGEEISAETEAQEIYKTKCTEFLKLAANFKDMNNIYIDGKNVLEEIAGEGTRLNTLADALEDITGLTGNVEDSAKSLLQTAEDERLSVSIGKTIEALEAQAGQFKDNKEIAELYAQKIAELKKLQNDVAAAETTGDFEKFREELKERAQVEKDVQEQLEQEKLELTKKYNALTLEQQKETAEEYGKAMEQIEKEISENLKQQQQERAQAVAGWVSQIGSYVQQTADVINGISKLALQNAYAQSETELADLEEKYAKGEVSEEEYYEKTAKIKKKAAQEEYKIQMWQWAASLATATASIAQGVAAALAQVPPASYVMAGLTAAAGAVQIAALTAAKPVPPSFATGGFLTGSSTQGDKIPFMGNAGEAILNPAEMRNFMDLANGKGATFPITVNNTQSDRVQANARNENNEVIIDIVDRHINAEFGRGTYDNGMAAYNANQQGVNIL